MAVTSYLDHFLDPATEALTPELAHTIADLNVNAQTQAHIGEL